jgi:epsilon-lactone hydrolase
VIALLTVIGMIVNRFHPAVLQRPPHRPSAAPRAAVGGHRDSDHAIVYFHGSALITLGLNSHRGA